MNRIPLKAMKKETYYEDEILLDKSYVLLTPDTPVTKELIKRLGEWQFSQIFTSGSTQFKESTSGASAGLLTTALLERLEKDKNKRKEILRFYIDMLSQLEENITFYKDKNSLRMNQLSEIVRKIDTKIHDNKDYILRLGDLNSSGYSYFITHAIRTTIITLAISMYNSPPAKDEFDENEITITALPPHKRMSLGLATLLHEIGVIPLGDKVGEHEGPMAQDEEKRIIAHPILGYRILKEYRFDYDALMAVLQHHENPDGTGYPQKLSSDKINSYAKMVKIACAYDARISERPHKKAEEPYDALYDMLKNVNLKYDDKYTTILLNLLSNYPLGSFVKLEDGSVGQVIKTNPMSSTYPEVLILTDKDGNPARKQDILLTSDEDGKRITELAAEEIAARFENVFKIDLTEDEEA